MATTSDATPLGSPFPDGRLFDADGAALDIDDLAGDGPVLLAFLSNHCPYVRHIEQAFGEVTAELAERGITVIGISSNDATSHPQDGPEGMAAQTERAGWPFPYLRDPDQALARAAGAVCTPDLFLYDGDRRLVYRGAFDGSTPGNDVPLTGEDLRAAADAVLEGRPAPEDQRPAMGCGIKWSPGNEPA
ncbi:MAG: thioredoxin family protein [Nitriliruptor sp.]|nr:MAG: thioredoxin family protein [Nitriliruptor sp.]